MSHAASQPTPSLLRSATHHHGVNSLSAHPVAEFGTTSPSFCPTDVVSLSRTPSSPSLPQAFLSIRRPSFRAHSHYSHHAGISSPSQSLGQVSSLL
ncbi:hypothetical protein M0R45_026256 [Rubus argutus]|uniref:Uncharacterized protein n=1 Tax=Rubus argutus TaxID=59490 RepID=A0AAW1WYS1_RUBAR